MEEANTTSLYSSYNNSGNSSTSSTYHQFCNISNLWNDLDLFDIFDYSSITSQHNSSDPNKMESHIQSVLYVTRWVVICIGLPLTMVAIYAFYTLVCILMNVAMNDINQACLK